MAMVGGERPRKERKEEREKKDGSGGSRAGETPLENFVENDLTETNGAGMREDKEAAVEGLFFPLAPLRMHFLFDFAAVPLLLLAFFLSRSLSLVLLFPLSLSQSLFPPLF